MFLRVRGSHLSPPDCLLDRNTVYWGRGLDMRFGGCCAVRAAGPDGHAEAGHGGVGSRWLDLTEECRSLARELLAKHAIPHEAPEDALHIAVAAVHGIHYLLTWNCAHIANATRREAIEDVCRDAGYEPPVICSPEELMGEL